MRRTLLLFAFLPFAALAAKEPSKLQAQFSVSFEKSHSTVDIDSQKFRYDGDLVHEEFEIKDCNRSVVERFLDQYAHLQKTDPQVPASLLGSHSIILKEGSQEKKIPRASQFGLWLRRLLAQSQTLRLTAEAKCKNKS